MKKRKLLILIFSIFFVEYIQAQVDEDVSPVRRPRKFVTLTMGIDLDDPLPVLPPNYRTAGDCRTKGVARSLVAEDINSVRFTPIAEGDCTFLFKDSKGRIVAEYRIEVRKSKIDTIAKEVRSLLGDIEGIQIKVINNKVIVDGQILLPKDMNRIVSVIRQFPDQADTIATISPLAMNKISGFIAKDIGNPGIIVRAVNSFLILEGEVNSAEEKARAERITQIYLPGTLVERAVAENLLKVPRPENFGIVNDIVVKAAAPAPPSKIIQVVVHYVELSKNYNKGFDIGWRPTLASDTGVTFTQSSRNPSGTITEIKGTISNLFPKLNWAKSHGFARILESATVIVQDGAKGNIKSTQSIPYQTSTGPTGTPSTSFAEVGMVTTVIPSIIANGRDDASQNIKLQLEFSISNAVPTASGAPLSSSNVVNTELNVRSGQSAAIGGLITNSQAVDYNKVPGGAGNAIINLSASKDFRKGQSQFVVFVTPVIKSSASAGSEKIKQKFRLSE